jgi:uncharacterized membrane protein YfcA
MIAYLTRLAYIVSYRSKTRKLSTKLGTTLILGSFIAGFICFLTAWRDYPATFIWFFVAGYVLAYFISQRAVEKNNFENIETADVIKKRGLYTLLYAIIALVSGLSIIAGFIIGWSIR